MLDKVHVELMGIFFLILYISATSATPIGEPGKAQNTNDDIHARARPPYRPYRCQYPYAWTRRECLPAVSPRAWQDVCVYTTLRNNLVPQYDNISGNCPENTVCLDGFNDAGRRFISCVSNADRKGKRKLDPQAGVSEPKQARNEIGNTQFEASIKITHDMSAAAVAAVLESSDGSFIIAPNNVISGNLHGTTERVCVGVMGDPVKARKCYPNNTYDFKAGQVIDFTWGMTREQRGKLQYAIVPEHSVPA